MPAKLPGTVLCKLTFAVKRTGRKSRTPGSAYRGEAGSFRCKYAGFVVCCKCRFGGEKALIA